jgi:hypothetical protein
MSRNMSKVTLQSRNVMKSEMASYSTEHNEHRMDSAMGRHIPEVVHAGTFQRRARSIVTSPKDNKHNSSVMQRVLINQVRDGTSEKIPKIIQLFKAI